MIGVYHEQGKVLIDLGERRRDVLLDCDAAKAFADALDLMADPAEREELANPSLVRGEPWNCRVLEFGGRVAVRFTPPGPGYTSKVPVPPRFARLIAGLVRQEEEIARNRLRVLFGGH